MRYGLGRFLQVLGLLIMPIGMAGNLLHPESISESHILMALCTGAVVFGVGRIIQGPSRT